MGWTCRLLVIVLGLCWAVQPLARNTLELSAQGLLLDDRQTILISGQLEYASLPAAQWPDRLSWLKAAGCNTVSTSVPWNLHAPDPHQTSLNSAPADLEKFLLSAREAGMYVALRIGPYIGQSADLGGLPAWLPMVGATPDSWRGNDADFLAAVDRWFADLLPLVERRQYTNGGPVVLVQIEETFDDDLERPGAAVYMRHLSNSLREAGLRIPIVRQTAQLRRPAQSEVVFGAALPATLSPREWSQGLQALQAGQPTLPLVVSRCDTLPHAHTAPDEAAMLSLGTRTRLALLQGAAWIDWQPFVGGLPSLLGPNAGPHAPIGLDRMPTPIYHEARRAVGWLGVATQDFVRSRPAEWLLVEDEAITVQGRAAVGGMRFAVVAADPAHPTTATFDLIVPRSQGPAQRVTTMLPPGGSRVITEGLQMDGNVSLGLSTAEVFALQRGAVQRVVLWDHPGARGVITVLASDLELIGPRSTPELMLRRTAQGLSVEYWDLNRPHTIRFAAGSRYHALLLLPREETAYCWNVSTPREDYLVVGVHRALHVSPLAENLLGVQAEIAPGPLTLYLYPPQRPGNPMGIELNGTRYSAQHADEAGRLRLERTVDPFAFHGAPLNWRIAPAMPEADPAFDDEDWVAIGERLLPFETIGSVRARHGWYRARFAWDGVESVTAELDYNERVVVFVNGEVAHRGRAGRWHDVLDDLLLPNQENVVALLASFQARGTDVTDLRHGAWGGLSNGAPWSFRPWPAGQVGLLHDDDFLDATALSPRPPTLIPLLDWRFEQSSDDPSQAWDDEPGTAAGMHARRFDDTNWRRIRLQGPLGQWYDATNNDPPIGWRGHGWFRATFRLDANQTNNTMALLDLGQFGCADRTFVNGRLVGEGGVMERRMYPLQLARLYRDRDNSVAVQLRHDNPESFVRGQGLPGIALIPLRAEGVWYRAQVEPRHLSQAQPVGVYRMEWGLALRPRNMGYVLCNGVHVGDFQGEEEITLALPQLTPGAVNRIDVYEQAVDAPTGQLASGMRLVPISANWMGTALRRAP